MEKGISYGPDMVAAKLAARKNQTRRLPDGNLVINVEPGRYKFHYMDSSDQGTREKPAAIFTDLRPEITPWLDPIPSPYGGVGDWLYTKEAYYTLSEYDSLSPSQLPAGAPIHYAADGPKPEGYGKYRHARFMPKALARFWDEITDLRMERVQDISEKDAVAEGVATLFSAEEIATTTPPLPFASPADSGWRNYMWHGNRGLTAKQIDSWPHQYSSYKSAKDSYSSLWASISGQESFDLNPWVWVITTKELSRTGRPSDEPAASPAPPVMVASPGGAPEPESADSAEETSITITPELQALLDKHPGDKALAVAAYELGMGDLREVLSGMATPRQPGSLSGRPPYRCLNDMPRNVVSMLNTTIVARVLEICLPFSLQYMDKDERRLLGLLEPHLQVFLNRSYTALVDRGLIPAREGFTTLQATKQFAEDMGDLHYECLHELNNAGDPREPFAAMKMYTELNMVQAAPAEAEEELACA